MTVGLRVGGRRLQNDFGGWITVDDSGRQQLTMSAHNDYKTVTVSGRQFTVTWQQNRYSDSIPIQKISSEKMLKNKLIKKDIWAITKEQYDNPDTKVNPYYVRQNARKCARQILDEWKKPNGEHIILLTAQMQSGLCE